MQGSRADGDSIPDSRWVNVGARANLYHCDSLFGKGKEVIAVIYDDV